MKFASHRRAALSLIAAGMVWVTRAQAAPPVVIQTVPVGNPGNAGDPQQTGPPVPALTVPGVLALLLGGALVAALARGRRLGE